MRRLSAGRVVALLLATLIIGNGLMLAMLHGDSVRDRARQESTSAARAAVTTIFTYSPSDMDDYRERALRVTTGRFTRELKTIIDGQIKAEARRKGTTIRTTVEAAAPVTTSSSVSTVLVFADQWRTDRSSKTPVLNAVRLKVTLHETSAGWRVARMKAI